MSPPPAIRPSQHPFPGNARAHPYALAVAFDKALLRGQIDDAEDYLGTLASTRSQSPKARYFYHRSVVQWLTFHHEPDTLAWLFHDVFPRRTPSHECEVWKPLISPSHKPSEQALPLTVTSDPTYAYSQFTMPPRSSHKIPETWITAFASIRHVMIAVQTGRIQNARSTLHALLPFFHHHDAPAFLFWCHALLILSHIHHPSTSAPDPIRNHLEQLNQIVSHLPTRPYQGLYRLISAFVSIRSDQPQRALALLQSPDIERLLPSRNTDLHEFLHTLRLQALLLDDRDLTRLQHEMRLIMRQRENQSLRLTTRWTLFLAHVRIHKNRKAKALARMWFHPRVNRAEHALFHLASATHSVRKARLACDSLHLWLAAWPRAFQSEARFLFHLWEVVMTSLGVLESPMSRTRGSASVEAKHNRQSSPSPVSIDSDGPAIPDHKWLAYAHRLARSNVPILITGETGTGKDYLARWLHQQSSRRRSPFLVINCAAIPSSLFESELFGYHRGAFTGATEPRPGLLERAGKGTILFDEIGDMPPTLQAKLLRVLQEKRIRRLGEHRERPIECRFFFATHQDLKGFVRNGRFREDLYYRIALFQLHLPPLRNRRDVIPHLVRTFIRRHRDDTGTSPDSITPEAITYLQSRNWPGNIRELEAAVRFALIHADRASHLDVEHFRPFFHHPPDVESSAVHEPAAPWSTRGVVIPPGMTLEAARAYLDYHYTRAALTENKGNRSATARQLGISRTHLYRLIKRNPGPTENDADRP